MGGKFLSVFVTFPDRDIAMRICKDVVEKRLAACANIVPAIQSVYWWDGAVQDGNEAAAILKTTEEKWPALKNAIENLHPYEVPCIVATRIDDGHEPYMNWIAAETCAV